MFAKLNLKQRKNRIKSRTLAGELFYVLIALFLTLFTVVLTVVVLWAVINAFKAGDDFDAGNYFGLPQPTGNFQLFDNFKAILTDFKIRTPDTTFYSRIFGFITDHAKEVYFTDMLLYTLIYAGGGAILQSFLPAIVAYMLCKYKFKFSKILYAIALFVYIIPIVGNYPAMITLMRDLGIYNTLYDL